MVVWDFLYAMGELRGVGEGGIEWEGRRGNEDGEG